MGPSSEPFGLAMMMIVAAVLLFALVALVAFFVLRSRYRPPARQETGPVESGTPSARVP